MDTPTQRLILAWIIDAIGFLSIAAAGRVFKWPIWAMVVGNAVLGGGLAAAGLRLVPIG